MVVGHLFIFLKMRGQSLMWNSSNVFFFSYGHKDFGYRLYDSVEEELIRSRGVIFLEDLTIEDIDKDHGIKSLGSTSTNWDADPILVDSDDLVLEPAESNQGGAAVQQEKDIDVLDDVAMDVHEQKIPLCAAPAEHVELRRFTHEIKLSNRYNPREIYVITKWR